MPSHCHCTVFACPLRTAAVSPAPSPFSFITMYLIRDDTVFDVDRRSDSFINTYVDTSALSRVPSLSPHQTPSTQPPPVSSDISTSTTSPAPLCHLQRPPNCLPKRPTILLRRSHLRGNPSLRRPRACFIFVVVGLCWLIVWVGEGAWTVLVPPHHLLLL
jgi:hypothetical protein